jgi:hypothetical protein
MELPEITLSGLTPFTAVLDGAWQSERDGGHHRQREWCGSIKAEQPFVAAALVRTENTLSWCRTPWPAASEHAVRITYSSYGPARQYFNAHLSVGNAIVQTHGLRTNTDARAIEIADGALDGARLHTLVRLAETQSVLGALLVAAGDARSARNHTWHLRGSDGGDKRAARIFGGRRNGSLILA